MNDELDILSLLNDTEDSSFDAILESIDLKTNFNPVKTKGTLSLDKFNKQVLTQEVLDKYKEQCASFGHCRISNMSKGYVYVDKGDKIVAFVNVVKKPDGIKWIQALNVRPNYQGYGLYEQLMKVAVRELGGTDIESPPKNDTAKKVYAKFGFHTYTDETTTHAMSIRSDARKEKYAKKARSNATTMEEDGLFPVYVVLSSRDKATSNFIKLMTHAPYSHACITFDPNCEDMYTFAMRPGHTMYPTGFISESMTAYAKHDPKSTYVVYVKLVNKEQRDILKNTVARFVKNNTEFKYDVGGAVKMFLGKKNVNEKKYFCSGFVAMLLEKSNKKDLSKNYSLYAPMDLTDVKNIHLVDMGLCRDFDGNYIKKKTKQIYEKFYMNKEKGSDRQPIKEDEDEDKKKE